ncbi:MAG: hypothetical protein AAFR05_11760 [Bacteroidota bacterium]
MFFSKLFNQTLLLALVLGLSLSACNKEALVEVSPSPQQEYPAQLTIDNWEQFVTAPSEVLEYHAQNLLSEEQRQIAAEAQTSFVDQDDQVLSGLQRVRAFNTAFGWATFPNLRISVVNSSGGVTCSFPSSFNFMDPNNGENYPLPCSGPRLRMEGPTVNVLNGLLPLAPDVDVTIAHILGTVPFTNARQYLAADANRDGIINIIDVVAIRRVQLGLDSTFPSSRNLLFIPEADYNELNAIVSSTGTLSQPLLVAYGNYPDTVSSQLTDRRMIKTGDVDGSITII